MCRIRVHSRASVCVHDQKREKKRKRQVNELNVRSSLWKKETPSLECIDTSRIKREIIVRQWILTDLYTFSIRGNSINRIFFSLSSISLGTTIGTGIISVIKESPNGVVQKWVNPRNKKEEKGVIHTAEPAT